MSNQYIAYYKHQAGTGISGFQGVRYQRGHGFFGRVLSSAIYPLLKFLGKQALSTGADIASDVIINKNNWRDSAKNRLNDAAVNITNAGVARARKFVQTGEGRRRAKKRTAPKSIKRVRPKRKTSNALANLLKNASSYS